MLFSKLRLIVLLTLGSLTTSVTQAGLFDAGDYLLTAGGDWDTAAGYIEFSEQTGDASIFEVGDIVIMYQDFSSLGSLTLPGDGTSSPASVWGITAFKATTYTDTSQGPPTPSNSARMELGALGSADFTTLLQTTFGIDISEVTIGADSTFALISSSTDTTLNPNAPSFSGFEADLIAGIGGTGFAQARFQSWNEFYYSYYDTSNSGINDGDSGFDFRYGLNVESVDNGAVAFGSVTATPFSGSSSLVSLTTQASTALSSAGTYTVADGDFDAALLVGSTVPEPGSFFVICATGFVGFVSRRRRA